MPKINQEEYEILKELGSKWKWVARDGECNSLNVFSVKPIKVHPQWDYVDVGYKHAWLIKEKNKMFQFIQWENSEPYNIDELIEEYEIKNGMRYDFGKIKLVDIDTSKLAAHNGFIYVKESEETEVKKDIEWLKEEVEKDIEHKHMEGDIYYVSREHILGLIDQLDEPEVLSQEWINEHEKKEPLMGPLGNVYLQHVVPSRYLQNLLVPKQEEITESFKEMVRKLVETNKLAMDVRKLTGMTLEEIKEEARNGGFVPKQEEVDQAYKDGYEKGKQHATEKQSEETKTVAGVFVDYLIAFAKLKLALSMEVEELEE